MSRLVLETGQQQTEALALYARAGFERIPPFGEYIGSPLSVCLAKGTPLSRPLRSVLGVIAGYLLFGVAAGILFSATGREPHAAAPWSFMILTTLYGMAFAAAGGYLAARIAGRAEVAHAMALSVVIAAGAVVSMVTSPSGGTVWSQLAALFLMAPCATLGGLLRRRRLT